MGGALAGLILPRIRGRLGAVLMAHVWLALAAVSVSGCTRFWELRHEETDLARETHNLEDPRLDPFRVGEFVIGVISVPVGDSTRSGGIELTIALYGDHDPEDAAVTRALLLINGHEFSLTPALPSENSGNHRPDLAKGYIRLQPLNRTARTEMEKRDAQVELALSVHLEGTVKSLRYVLRPYSYIAGPSW